MRSIFDIFHIKLRIRNLNFWRVSEIMLCFVINRDENRAFDWSYKEYWSPICIFMIKKNKNRDFGLYFCGLHWRCSKYLGWTSPPSVFWAPSVWCFIQYSTRYGWEKKKILQDMLDILLSSFNTVILFVPI